MSSAIGRLQAALANVTNEVTVAAANLNFDFTLVKYEVPREYEPIGKMLSPFRKQKAENGPAHVTARRLAALFDGICPRSPALVKAYGTRASEIVQQATDKQPKEHYSSVFSQYAGVDATSMWAAATSSNAADGGAVHIHLLACLISSAFEESHAISIWSELVERRRAEINTRFQNGESVHFALAAAAAQAEIPREQLAEWDASARSWLQTADSVKTHEKTLYGHILNRIDITANPSNDLYENVTGVWRTATEALNNLVLGIPQEVLDGATVIGLKAWHLFPDTQFFGGGSGHVDFNDPLIPKTGILTVGCSGSSISSVSGVNWSLSLEHLKFYGEATKVTGLVKPDPSLMTVEEFHLVILGTVFRLWNIDPSDELESIRLIQILIAGNASHINMIGRLHMKSCYRLLEKAMALYRLRPDSRKFISLGRNRPEFGPLKSHIFVGAQQEKPEDIPESERKQLRPFFGLLYDRVLVASMKTPAARLRILLEKCQKHRHALCKEGALIRYQDGGEIKIICLVSENQDPQTRVPVPDAMNLEYMEWQDIGSLKPVDFKRMGIAALVESYSVTEAIRGTKRRKIYQQEVPPCREDSPVPQPVPAPCQEDSPVPQPVPAPYREDPPVPLPYPAPYLEDSLVPEAFLSPYLEDSPVPQPVPGPFEDSPVPEEFLSPCREDSPVPPQPVPASYREDPLVPQRYPTRYYEFTPPPQPQPQPPPANFTARIRDNELMFGGKKYRLYFGAHDLAALYIPMTASSSPPAPSVSPKDFLTTPEEEFGRKEKLWDSIANDALYAWLNNIGTALSYLCHVAGPVISVGVLNGRCRSVPHWVDAMMVSGRSPLDSDRLLSKTFSVLAHYLAECEFHYDDLDRGVSGLSYKDSIYVPTVYLRDPSKLAKEVTNVNNITRILGNIGRPGLALFFPVVKPVVPLPSNITWRFVDDHAFDGRPDDYFKSTSMHLSFTGWEVSMGNGQSQGYRDSPFLRKETFVSIRDRGDWISDVNLEVVQHPWIFLLPEQPPCGHSDNYLGSNSSMRAIRSWEELCEVRSGVNVVQAHGNWLARLAITAYLAQRDLPLDVPDPRLSREPSSVAIVLIPDKVCWACIRPGYGTVFYIH